MLPWGTLSASKKATGPHHFLIWSRLLNKVISFGRKAGSLVRPFHDNIARAVLQTPKFYFDDTGLVVGDDGLRFENLVATSLHKHVQWQHDVQGRLKCQKTKINH